MENLELRDRLAVAITAAIADSQINDRPLEECVKAFQNVYRVADAVLSGRGRSAAFSSSDLEACRASAPTYSAPDDESFVRSHWPGEVRFCDDPGNASRVLLAYKNGVKDPDGAIAKLTKWRRTPAETWAEARRVTEERLKRQPAAEAGDPRL
jgi:hypothetical protein